MRVTIKTPSRLHLGILDLNGGLGRLYGSIGVSLERPNFVLEVEPAERLQVYGGDSGVISDLIKKFTGFYGLSPRVRVELKEVIPEHVGLGSGTQLALAVAVSLSRIYGLGTTLRDFASVMGRGTLSGIGIAAFERGGFIIDSGVNVLNPQLPKVVFRHSFPESWSFIVAIPDVKRGFSGNKEEDALKKVVPASEKISAEICRIVQMKMLPSLLDRDISSFGQSLSLVDKKTGLYFRDVQDGVYREEISGELVQFMLDSGAYAAGQSSWGPAVYGLVDEKRKGLKKEVEEFLRGKGVQARVFISKADNKGASIEVEQ